MPIYTSTGAFNVAVNDTTGTGRYSASGALRINLVTGASYVGLYAADGALNVVDVSGVNISTYGGLYHPSGAIRGRTAPTTLSGLQAPDGSYYFLGLFSPLNLFANDEQGAWYDPSDFSTMFQDSAGTTPVTAVEQPVGLLLDKSKGGRQALPLTGWVKNSGDGTVTVDGGTITITGATTTTRVDINAPGYAIGDLADMTVTGSVAGATGPLLFLGGGNAYSTLSGTNTFRNVIVSSTLLRLQISTGSATYVVTSRGYVPGNHASQSTAASRPVLSARVNLLTYSEQFDNAIWSKPAGTTTINPNQATAPDGTMTADLVTATAGSACHYVVQINSVSGSVTATIYAKSGTASWLGLGSGYTNGNETAWFDLSTGTRGAVAAGGTSTMTDAGNGWWRCSHTRSSWTGGAILPFITNANNAATFNAVGTETIYIWGADLRVTNVGVNLPAYQRVAAATDYDTSGFPLYLKFDGVDDSLATGTIDFTATDKMSVFAGVRKLSDAAAGMILELSSSLNGNPGTFYFLGPYSNGQTNYNFSSKGTLFAEATGAGFVAPITSVLTGTGDIIGDLVRLRSNGTQVASSVADQGAGNFGNYALYIGRRGGSTLPYNGNLYSLIVRGALSTDAQIASTETYVNNLTKAY